MKALDFHFLLDIGLPDNIFEFGCFPKVSDTLLLAFPVYCGEIGSSIFAAPISDPIVLVLSGVLDDIEPILCRSHGISLSFSIYLLHIWTDISRSIRLQNVHGTENEKMDNC